MGTKQISQSGPESAQHVADMLSRGDGKKKKKKNRKGKKFVKVSNPYDSKVTGVHPEEAFEAIEGRDYNFCLVLDKISRGVYCDPCKKKFCPMDLGKAEKERIVFVAKRRG